MKLEDEPKRRADLLGRAVLAALALYVVVVLRKAWASDDAFITLRTVHNFVHGDGLRWNLAERVQSYTHPLWMLVLSGVYALLRSPYFTLVISGIATSIATAVFLAKCVARTPAQAILALLILTASRSFTDYSTSGLENPLLHLLAALSIWLFFARPGALRPLSLALALLACTRLDAVIMFAPLLALGIARSLARRGPKATLLDLAIGASPLLGWELFSIVYYGFPFPNTAYAKLSTGIPALELAQQGLIYVLSTLSWDPVLLASLALGTGLAARSADRAHKLLALGAVAYVLYVIKVGGDFMSGRFLTLPLFVLVCSFACNDPLPRATLLRLAVAFAVLLILPRAQDRYSVGKDYHVTGIADERAYYRKATSLVLYARGAALPRHKWKGEGKALPAHRVSVVGAVGMRGFYAPPSAHVIDLFALTDPLLARLPVEDVTKWRVGHYRRAIPEGYRETLEGAACKLAAPGLCAYYEKLRLVVRGELWSAARFAAIVALNLGDAYAPPSTPAPSIVSR